MDWSRQQGQLSEAIIFIESDMRRPFVLLSANMVLEGNQWCAFYGDFRTGVAGFGDSPDADSRDFDKKWYEKLSTNAAPPPGAQ